MKDYKEIYEKRYGSKKSTTQLSKNNKLINNRLARLEAGGVDTTSALDDRTALEKLLNLRQNQGAFRDVFEVLGRPQQALFSGWKASQEGKDIKEAALSGLKGKDYTQFKDILKIFPPCCFFVALFCSIRYVQLSVPICTISKCIICNFKRCEHITFH